MAMFMLNKKNLLTVVLVTNVSVREVQAKACLNVRQEQETPPHLNYIKGEPVPSQEKGRRVLPGYKGMTR